MTTPINPTLEPALDSISVAPGLESETRAPVNSADAGTDASIAARLERNPASQDARLDRGLDESMDASDPPASTQPVHSHSHSELPESSGFNPKKEERIAAGKTEEPGLVERVLNKIGLA